MKNFGYFLRVAMGFAVAAPLISCSTLQKSGQAGENSVVGEVRRDPSPIDPQKPPTVHILGLSEGQLVKESPLKITVETRNYPLGRNWQGAVIVLNDQGPVSHVYRSGDSIELAEGLREGPNLLRVFLTRPKGECLKNPESIVAIDFHYKKASSKDETKSSQPALFVNSPMGSFSGSRAKKILFDFVVTGTHVSPRQNHVQYSLNGEQRELSNWDAYTFQNLPPGTYTLQLQLVDSTGKLLRGPYTSTTTNFTVGN